uniref:Nicotinamide-nucleotide amidohydrolase family protein n=1 Tax=candidate division WOR-3 bacterium TaxID=2052148 RepID=A0A7C3ND81_UNCW3
MKASIIIVGDEILKNRIVERNSTIISNLLLKKGYFITGKYFVGDNFKNINRVLHLSIKDSKIIVITGGLGPTVDDITLSAVAKSLKRKLVFSEKIYEKISKKMKADNKILIRQSLTISGSKIFENGAGIAFCHSIVYKGVKIFLLPGVTREVEWITDNVLEKVIPNRAVRKEYNIKIFDTTETQIYQLLKEEFDSKTISDIHFYPIFGFIDLYFSKKEILKFLKNKFKGKFLETDAKDLNLYLKGELEKKNLKLSVAESCTGGLLSKYLTDIEGSSKFFLGGVVVYSNGSKNSILKVDRKLLEKYGAVSSEVAEMMAKNCSKIFRSDISVSITGIAGPSGGSIEKPVGTVFISTFYKNRLQTEKYVFNGSRDIVRQKSVNLSIFSILRRIKNE